jgi:glycosyltransferase involved in cell wall biosynthesis
VATIVYIPFLAGYFAQSLDVLKLCLTSIFHNTEEPYDLLVFDNGSCEEVIMYLRDLHVQGRIQYLILSGQNIGKVRAWNFIFGAAPGEYLAYTDSDVFFRPGWLQEEMKVLEAFPNVGMVAGMPAMGNFGEYTKSTLTLAEADAETKIERGQFIPDDWIIDFGKTLGYNTDNFLKRCHELEQVRLTRRGVTAYAVSTHFQFLARTSVMGQMVPLTPLGLVGPEHVLDEKVDQAGYMRLAVSTPMVHHLGNVLSDDWKKVGQDVGLVLSGSRLPNRRRILYRVVRHHRIKPILMKFYHFMFRLLSQKNI